MDPIAPAQTMSFAPAFSDDLLGIDERECDMSGRVRSMDMADLSLGWRCEWSQCKERFKDSAVQCFSRAEVFHSVVEAYVWPGSANLA